MAGIEMPAQQGVVLLTSLRTHLRDAAAREHETVEDSFGGRDAPRAGHRHPRIAHAFARIAEHQREVEVNHRDPMSILSRRSRVRMRGKSAGANPFFNEL